MTGDDEMAARLAEKWGVDPEAIAQRKRVERALEGEPLPVRVLVEKLFEGRGPNSFISDDEPQYRFFLAGVYADGSERPLLNTKSVRLAQSEVERFQKMGIPVDPRREDRR